MYDEPFADSSQIPTYLVSAMTRKHVTVALSGDGGDELFAGYNRYQLGHSPLARVVAPAKRAPARRCGRDHPRSGRTLVASFWISPGQGAPRSIRRQAPQACVRPGTCRPRRGLPPSGHPLGAARRDARRAEFKGVLWDPNVAKEMPGFLEQMQFLDLVTYLPDDILTKVDRASMAVALEARVPLIDHRVVEFAWRLPSSAKIRNGKTKWLLRQVLDRHVPRELIERPKMGFGIPLGEWLRGPLRDWAEALLDERRLREAGLLDASSVRRHWHEHLEGQRNWQYLIWDVLMLETWRERWG